MGSIISWWNELTGADQYGNMTDRDIALRQQQQMTDYNAQVNKDYNEYITKNSASWQVQGLQQAGLNPVLAATGGYQPTNAGTVQQGHVPITNANSLTSAMKVATVIAGIVTKNPKLVAMGIGTPTHENNTTNYNNNNSSNYHNNNYYDNKFFKK